MFSFTQHFRYWLKGSIVAFQCMNCHQVSLVSASTSPNKLVYFSVLLIHEMACTADNTDQLMNRQHALKGQLTGKISSAISKIYYVIEWDDFFLCTTETFDKLHLGCMYELRKITQNFILLMLGTTSLKCKIWESVTTWCLNFMTEEVEG